MSWLLLTIIIFLILYIASAIVWPDVKILKNQDPNSTAFMEYREGQWGSHNDNKPLRYKWIPLNQISPNVRFAVVVAEDKNFYQHKGFDFVAIKAAIKQDIKEKSFSFGGSTISQQLVKNLYLSPSKNPLRKIREAILTWRIERELSKERILELYLNVVEWGDGIFGIEEAAELYYGKDAASLSLNEATRLAVVLPSPIKYTPIEQSQYVNSRVRFQYDFYNLIDAKNRSQSNTDK